METAMKIDSKIFHTFKNDLWFWSSGWSLELESTLTHFDSRSARKFYKIYPAPLDYVKKMVKLVFLLLQFQLAPEFESDSNQFVNDDHLIGSFNAEV